MQDKLNRNAKGGDLHDELLEYKNRKQVLRMQQKQDEDAMVELMQELEQRKEKELRARIEKEEIARNIKNLERRQLTDVEIEKRRDLEKLASERENLRMREDQMMDDIKDLEKNLIDKEKQFRQVQRQQN
jgi:hypothetical protein